MMSGFPKKLVLAVVAIYLLVGLLPVNSAVFSDGGERSLWHIDCRDGLKKRTGRREGNFGCQGDIASSLRTTLSPPPPPFKSKAGSQRDAAPPPSVS
ncbi:hypothetical protein ABKV19_012165 [Rosa sericea]